ncbi:MAG: diadenylate cyclase CdaA [Paludibacteraceae bacterium]|nr:diadenylate cyclase CdaA [Paludibacteraceae bacterium]
MLEILSTFRFKDLIDILLVGLLMYQTYRLLKGTSGMYIFSVVLSFIILSYLVSNIFDMKMLGAIMTQISSVGAILLIVLFQDELRSFARNLGQRQSNNIYKRIQRIFKTNKDMRHLDSNATEIVAAATAFAKTKTGALIVIQNQADLSQYCQTGEHIDARIKARLMENIFFKNTPLHDGALIIVHDRICAVGCILPISHSQDLPKQFGLRHRAAMGISEKTDATVVVISEETGNISIAEKGAFKIGVTPQELKNFLLNGTIDWQTETDNQKNV